MQFREASRRTQIVTIAVVGCAIPITALLLSLAGKERALDVSHVADRGTGNQLGVAPADRTGAAPEQPRTIAERAAPRVAPVSLVSVHKATPEEREAGVDPPRETFADVAARLENRFQLDGRTTSESHRVESLLRQGLSAEGVSLESLTCRTRTCRAEVTFSNAQVGAEVTRKMFVDQETMIAPTWGFTIPVHIVRPDGTIAVTMYLTDDTGEGRGG